MMFGAPADNSKYLKDIGGSIMSKILWRRIVLGLVGLIGAFIVIFLILVSRTNSGAETVTVPQTVPSGNGGGVVQPDTPANTGATDSNYVTGEVDPVYGYEYGPSYDGGVTHTAPAQYPPELQVELDALTGIYTWDESQYKLPKVTSWIAGGSYGRNANANWLCGYRELMNFADVTDLEIDEKITPVITEYAIDAGGIETTMSIAPVTKYTRDENGVIWFYGYVLGGIFDEDGNYDEEKKIKEFFHCGYNKVDATVKLVPATREEIEALPEDERYYYTAEEFYNHVNLPSIAVGNTPWGEFALSEEERTRVVNSLD
jgi:hypothetical protein